MAAIAVLALLLILQSAAANEFNDLLSPLLSPIFEDVCKQVNCGKGSCKPSDNDSFSFECDCDSGWKKSLSDDDDDDDDDGHFKFLPCIIPNCTLTHSCSSAPPPGIQTKPRTKDSIFDPCSWVNCGGGSCNKTSPLTYKCDCLADYYNLLNITAFPCYKDCSIGMDCKELGIPVASSPPATASSTNNNAASGLLLKRDALSTISSVVTCVATLLLLIK